MRMAKKKKVIEPRVAAVDDIGVLKRDIGRMILWIVVSVAIAAVVAVGVENFIL
jgi:hypothetical protein